MNKAGVLRGLMRKATTLFSIFFLVLTVSNMTYTTDAYAACIGCVTRGNENAHNSTNNPHRERMLLQEDLPHREEMLLENDLPHREEWFTKLFEQLKKMSEQASVERLGIIAEAAKQTTASDVNRAKTTHENQMTNIGNRLVNAESYACSDLSISRNASAYETARKAINAIRTARREKKTASAEKGLIQYQNELYQAMQSLEPGKRFDVGEVLMTNNIPSQSSTFQHAEHTASLLYDKIPVKLLEDLENNPDTSVKNALVEAERLQAEMMIGESVFAILMGNRTPDEGAAKSAQWIRDIMKANEFKDDTINQILGNKPSWRAILEALAVGTVGEQYGRQKVVATSENAQRGLVFQTMLTNMLLFEQYKLLETIALATSTNVIAVREEAIKDVNARLTAKNAGQ